MRRYAVRVIEPVMSNEISSPFPPAVVLLSGGLDSTTVMALAREQGFAVNALSFDYGQRHRHELDLAREIARTHGLARHVVVNFDLRAFGGSALTSSMEVPKDRNLDVPDHRIPVTYVPARNTIFLSFALGWAEVLGARDIFIGVNALDYSGYPDCRPEFLHSFEAMARLATRSGVEGTPVTLHAPLVQMTKAEIIREGIRLGVDYAFTTSCYDPDGEGRPCARCDACLLRAKGFREAGVPDPLYLRFGMKP